MQQSEGWRLLRGVFRRSIVGFSPRLGVDDVSCWPVWRRGFPRKTLLIHEFSTGCSSGSEVEIHSGPHMAGVPCSRVQAPVAVSKEHV